MPLLPEDPHRLTPYDNFRFRMKLDNVYVLGVSKVSGLSRSSELPQRRAGGDPSSIHLAPGQTSYGPITLERGVSYDVTFEQWAKTVFDWTNSQSAAGENTSLLDFRKPVTIEVFNETGVRLVAYRVHNAWVSEFSATSDLDGVGNRLIVESMTLQNEGWERDDAIVDVVEPSFIIPAKNPPS